MTSETVACVRSATLRVMTGDVRSCVEIFQLEGGAYGFEDLVSLLAQSAARAVEAYCFTHDLASQALLQRLGLALAGESGSSGTRDAILLVSTALEGTPNLLPLLMKDLEDPVTTAAALATLLGRTVAWSQEDGDDPESVLDGFLLNE